MMDSSEIDPTATDQTTYDLESQKTHYLDLAHRLCTPPDDPKSEIAWLWTLHAQVAELVKFLTRINEYITSGPIVMKERVDYDLLIQDNLRNSSYRKVAQTLVSWSKLSTEITGMHTLIQALQQEYTNKLNDIRKVLFTSCGISDRESAQWKHHLIK